jgi:predicted  nucleic acid-binding Zn-ribbon protein
MAGPAAILRELHRLRRHARDLQSEIDRGPRTLKTQQDKVAKQEEVLREAQEGIKRLKLETHDKELTLRTKQQQIAKHERQLNESTSKKEYDALQAEINSDRRACQRLEDEILDRMGETETQTAQLPELEKAVQRAREDAARVVDDIQARRNSLTERLNEVHQNISEVEATLPEDVRTYYQRQLTARGEDALSAVLGRTCTACYTEITAQNYNDLAQGQFVLCKSCGRILYLPE